MPITMIIIVSGLPRIPETPLGAWKKNAAVILLVAPIPFSDAESLTFAAPKIAPAKQAKFRPLILPAQFFFRCRAGRAIGQEPLARRPFSTQETFVLQGKPGPAAYRARISDENFARFPNSIASRI